MSKHPDADAFMRKYLTQPTDVTARLVFADWLEETGVPHNMAWAYYIRLKAEAGHHPPDSRERRELDREADTYAPRIRANLTIPAALFVGYPKSLLQLLPAPNLTVKLANFEVSQPVLALVPASVARVNSVLPLDLQGNTLLGAAANPRDEDTAQKLAFILNHDIIFVGAEQEDILRAIDRHPEYAEVETVDEMLVEFVDTAGPWHPPSPPEDADSPIIRLVNLILLEATNLRADRVSLTPESDGVHVRYRIDGAWGERDSPPRRLLHPMTARLAIMVDIPVEWASANPPSFTPMSGECVVHLHTDRFRVYVTIRPAADGPTTELDLFREPATLADK